MNVCLMNDSFPPLIDGVANAVLNYAEIITRDHGSAIVATPQLPGAVDDYLFPVVRFPSIDTTKKMGYRAGYPFDPEVVGRLSREPIDIIHSHCPITSTILARLLRDQVNAPIIMTYHTKFDIDIAKAINGKLVQEAAIKLLVGNIEACDEVWVVSRGAGENLRNLGFQGDYIVMENGVDLPRGAVEREKSDALTEKYGLKPGMPVFIFVGRIMWYKGLRLILDGLAGLRDSGQDFKMVFIGEGADKPEVESYANQLNLGGCCLFLGAIHDRELIRTWYSRADLMLFPSTFDTNGLVVREGAACGLPALLVRNSCAAEGITDGRTGIIIDENRDAMTEALKAACINTDKLKDIGQEAMNEIYVSWDQSVSHAWERYEVVLDGWRRGRYRRRKLPMDDFFSVYGDILDGMDKVKNHTLTYTEKLKSYRQQIQEHLDRYL